MIKVKPITTNSRKCKSDSHWTNVLVFGKCWDCKLGLSKEEMQKVSERDKRLKNFKF